MSALGADRAVRMTSARREVVGADHGRATGDLAPAADVVRRRERGDVALLVVGGEPGDAPNLAERALVEQQGDTLAARELAPAALADHPASVEPGANRDSAKCCSVPTSSRTPPPGLVADPRRRGGAALGVVVGGCDRNHDLPGRHHVADAQGLHGGDPSRARRVTSVSIFIALMTSNVSPAVDESRPCAREPRRQCPPRGTPRLARRRRARARGRKTTVRRSLGPPGGPCRRASSSLERPAAPMVRRCDGLLPPPHGRSRGTPRATKCGRRRRETADARGSRAAARDWCATRRCGTRPVLGECGRPRKRATKPSPTSR